MRWGLIKTFGIMLLSAEGILLLPRMFDPVQRLKGFMSQNNLSSASIVYGKIGDKPNTLTINATPERIYPYYSLSKPITAAVVLDIVAGGVASLDAPFVGTTPRDLLRHSGGWDSRSAGDPVTSRTSPSRCIDIAVPPRQFVPGTRQEYSNLGYCLLGRWVERQTGQTFERVVRQRIPETHKMLYNDWLGPAGGWSGTALSYWHFATRPVDAEDTKRLPPTEPPWKGYRGLGWRVTPGYLTHFGFLGRGFSVVVRQKDSAAVALFDGAPSMGPDKAAETLRPILLNLK